MNRPTKILVTGFNRFGKLELNPTELAMDEVRRFAAALQGCEVVAEVLPTEFEAAGGRLCELIASHDPDAFLGFGVAARSQSFQLERFALNIDDSRESDNAGRAPAGAPIVARGPAAYLSTLPLEEIFGALQDARVPVTYSNHAGTFVCNHAFYLARHAVELRGSAKPCGFIHVPLTLSSPDSKSPVSVNAGVLVCIEAVRRHLTRTRV